ncbi:MAG: HRDC domain-containing protein, partial [Oscillospiraceae bacterium]|nr:HRDC domain-containing protein [Oscillospiraceae bacterium]
FRVAQRGRRCGTKMLCDILQGKDTKQLKEAGYQTLSTYGLLGDISRIHLEHMVSILLSRGYLMTDTGQYATLSLTPKANAVLRGQETVQMALPQHDLKQTRREQQLANMPDYGVDEVLFQKLRRVREKLAAKEFVPAYIVFSDATLRDMCNKRPLDETQMLAISGVGRYKMDKYGEAFLTALREYAAEQEPAVP